MTVVDTVTPVCGPGYKQGLQRDVSKHKIGKSSGRKMWHNKKKMNRSKRHLQYLGDDL